MILEEDGTGFFFEGTAERGGGGEVFVEFLVLVDDDAVELDGHGGPGGAGSIGIKFGIGEIDVVGLPGEGWEAHVDRGSGDGVDATGFVHETIEAEGIEDLGFPTTTKVNTAVSTTLATGVGLVGGEEFKMEGVVFEGLLAGGAGGEEEAVFHLCVGPSVGAGAIEKEGGTFGRFRPKSRALTSDSGEFGDVFPGKLGGLSGDGQIEVTIPGEGNKLTFPLSAQFDPGFVFGPSESGEASF